MSEPNGRIKVSVSLLMQIAVWLVSVLLAYGALSTRLSVLEDRYERMVNDVSEIKSDVKRLLVKP